MAKDPAIESSRQGLERLMARRGKSIRESGGALNVIKEEEKYSKLAKERLEKSTHKFSKGKKRKIEFNVGDKFNTHGHSNMVGVVTLRKIEGRKIFFTDSEKTDYQGFDASTARKLIEAKEWTKVVKEYHSTKEDKLISYKEYRTGSTKLFPLIVVAAILIGISVSGLAIVANSNSNGSTG